MSRVATDAIAFNHRDAQAMIMVGYMAPKSAQTPCPAGEHEADLAGHRAVIGGVYGNFLADKGEQGVRDAYLPATYARLAALKQCYDPTNLFRLNQNIKLMMEESKQETF